MNNNQTSINAQGNVVIQGGNIASTNSIANYTVNPQQKQDLATAAEEIQALLDQLSQTYPTETIVEKAQLAAMAADQAQARPSLAKRILSALDAGTIGAIEQALNHPVASFFIQAVEDWNQ